MLANGDWQGAQTQLANAMAARAKHLPFFKAALSGLKKLETRGVH